MQEVDGSRRPGWRLAGRGDLAGGLGDKGKRLDSGSALETKLMAGHKAEGRAKGVPDDTRVSGCALQGQQSAWLCQGVWPFRSSRCDSQHEILLPAGLAAPYGNGRALDILHLQGHIRIEFLCGSERRGQCKGSGTPPYTFPSSR